MEQHVKTLPPDNTMQGVIIKELKTFPDNRGYFREIFRCNDPIFLGGKFGQWSNSKMQKDVVKAWHYHHVQTDWWYVPVGQLETVLYDNREESPTYRTKLVIRMGEPDKFGADTFAVCVKIPPGVLHACKVLSEEAHLFYITSETYNPNDEGRFPYNSDIVGHDWGCDAIVVDNDKRTFVPTAARKV